MTVPDHPAALRNRGPILNALRPLLSANSRVLEVASGNALHAHYFAARLPKVHWQPSEADPEARAQAVTRQATQPLSNLAAPLAVDVLNWRTAFDHQDAPVAGFDLLLTINLLHVSPIEATDGVIDMATTLLTTGGRLAIYGPFKIDGEHISPGNAAFDQQLRAQNARWGIRDVREVQYRAELAGLKADGAEVMPANNRLLLFTRTSPG